jgi:phage-related minor tail protein
MSILGVAAGAFAGIEFLKGSVEAFNESEQASAQLDATLKSTANAANLNREALDEQALSLMNTSLFDDDAITHTQGLLATFTNIKDAIYMDAVPAIADLATKLGGDLQGATIQVGKALNDPIHGITALSRAGVSFSESQKNVIENLQKTGDIAGAQRIILAELNKEFAGSALASATTGTGAYTVLQHQMGNVKEEIGGIVVAIGNELLPMFVSMVEGIHDVVQGLKDGWKWIKENRVVFESLAVGFTIERPKSIITAP